MKSFLKIVLGSCTGTLIGGVMLMGLAFLMLIGLSVSAWRMAEQKQLSKTPKQGSVLNLNLNFEIPQYLDKDPLNRIDFNSFEVKNMMGLDSLLLSIDRASKDKRIQGMNLKLSGFRSNWSTAWEIRQALAKFKENDKWIVCYGEQFSQQQYYLASVASKVFLHPKGEMTLTGLSMDSVFFGRLFSKLGVEVQALRGMNNIYKSAVEPFTRESFSAENRLQMEAIVKNFWKVISQDMVEGRNLEKINFEKIVSELGPRDANAALSNGLVDELFERDELEAYIDEEMSQDYNKPSKISIFEYSKYLKLYPSIANATGSSTIALIHADGPIQGQKSQDRVIHSGTINKWIKEAAEDDKVKGIIVRVNSPGGGAFASELIYSEIAKAQELKPVMVSFGSMAASGGYYMSCGSANISTTPLTLTGSIGVFGILPALEKFLEEKLYVTHDGVKTHPHADAMNGMRPLTPPENKIIQNKINDIYTLFKSRVSEGRSMDDDRVEEVARGRVWTGDDALVKGLVDHTGGLLSVIENMKKTLGIKSVKHPLKVWPKDLEWKDWMKNFEFEGSFMGLNKYFDSSYLKSFKMLESMREGEKLQTRLPYLIEIH